MSGTPQAFSLNDLAGTPHVYPNDTATLVCFVKEDCDTCNTAAPVLEALHRAHGDKVSVMLIGQSGDDNATFGKRHGLSMPLLDDRFCKAAFAWDIESVPSVFWIDKDGEVLSHFEGFVRADWEVLAADLSRRTAQPVAQVDWDSLPAWRPGCGSKHLDPSVYDKLRAEADDSPIRARKIDVAADDDVAEFMFDQGADAGGHPP